LDDRKYSNNFVLLQVTQNGLVGTITVHADLTLDESLNAFTGTYVFKIVDADGNVTLSGGGSREGTRFTQ